MARYRMSAAAAAIVILCLGVFCSSVMDASSKILAEKYNILQIMWLRYVVYMIVVIALHREGPLTSSVKNTMPLLVVISIVQLFAGLLYVYSFSQLSLASVQAAASAGPIIVVALAVVFLSEKIVWFRLLAIILSIFGLYLSSEFESVDRNWSALAPLAAAAASAVVVISTRALTERKVADLTIMRFTAFATVVCLGPLAALSWVTPSLHDCAIYLIAGLFCVMRDYARVNAYKRAQASLLQPYVYTNMIWAIFFGFFLFADVPNIKTLAGAALVISAGLLSYYCETRINQKDEVNVRV